MKVYFIALILLALLFGACGSEAVAEPEKDRSQRTSSSTSSNKELVYLEEMQVAFRDFRAATSEEGALLDEADRDMSVIYDESWEDDYTDVAENILHSLDALRDIDAPERYEESNEIYNDAFACYERHYDHVLELLDEGDGAVIYDQRSMSHCTDLLTDARHAFELE